VARCCSRPSRRSAICTTCGGAPLPGVFSIDGGTVSFHPRLPCRPDLADAALQPGRRYRVEVRAPPALCTLRSARGQVLARGFVGWFETAGADLPLRWFEPEDATRPRAAASLAGSAREGVLELVLDGPIDPRALSRVQFRLGVEWRSAPDDLPMLPALLVANDGGARIRLEVPEAVRDLCADGERFVVAARSQPVLETLRFGAAPPRGLGSVFLEPSPAGGRP